MKACIDCQRHYTSWEGYERHLCAAGGTDPISGRPDGESVILMRSLRGKCGPDARLFVPKPPESLFKRLVRAIKEY